MVRSSLRHTPTLLVIDNADSVGLAVAEAIAVLVADVPDLSVLVTSRQPLGLTGERVLTLTPLPSAEGGTSSTGPPRSWRASASGPRAATPGRARSRLPRAGCRWPSR